MSGLQSIKSLMESRSVNPDEIYVLTKEGLAELTRAIFANVNTRIQERIVTEMNEESDDNHVASAKTVHEAVKGLSRLQNLIIASGDINEAEITPDSNTLYILRKDESEDKGVMYIWIEGIGYINCGGTISESTELNVNAISKDMISQIVADSYTETDPGINTP